MQAKIGQIMNLIPQYRTINKGTQTKPCITMDTVTFKGISPKALEILEDIEETAPKKVVKFLTSKIKAGIELTEHFKDLDNYLQNGGYVANKAECYRTMIKTLKHTDKANPLIEKLYLNLGNTYYEKLEPEINRAVYYGQNDFNADSWKLIEKTIEAYDNFTIRMFSHGKKLDKSAETRLERAKFFSKFGDLCTAINEKTKAEESYKLALSESIKAHNNIPKDGKWDSLTNIKAILNKLLNFYQNDEGISDSIKKSLEFIQYPVHELELKEYNTSIEQITNPFYFVLNNELGKQVKYCMDKVQIGINKITNNFKGKRT